MDIKELNKVINSLNVYNNEYLNKQIQELSKITQLTNERFIDNFKSSYNFNIPQINFSQKIHQEIIPMINNITKSINEKMNHQIKELLNFDISTTYLNKITDSLVENCSILGSYGWSYYFVEDINEHDYIMQITAPKDFKKFLEENPEATIKSIDEFIAKRFTKNILIKIIEKTNNFLDENDKIKIQKALTHYNAKRYYDCASMLLGLIDAQNIKQELYDLNNNNYATLNIDNNGIANVDQGWNAFVIVFRNNLAKYFNNKNFIGKNKNNKSKNEHFEQFVNDTKYDMNTKIGIDFLCIAYPLLTLFNDNSWKEYPNKPSVINRNWLMHGMYNIEDINKYDCIKLFLMLYQLTNLFNKIRTNTLDE